MFAEIAILLQLVAILAVPEAVSVADFCRHYPDRATRLFGALDLEREGMEAVAAAAGVQDWPRACEALLTYYRSSRWTAKMRIEVKAATDARDPDADAILEDGYTLYAVSAKVPRRPDGGLDWTYNGPTGDPEWGWGLNRQPWIGTLIGAYSKTGNPCYIEALDKLLRDWVASNPYPGEKNNTPQWRGLEVFMRIAIHWPQAFYALQDFAEFSPATRLLMLSSVPDHAHYNRNFHASRGNWITMELRGLASAAAYWPEFKEASAWLDYAIEQMTPELTRQVYPDGAQKELTSDYHRVALYSFDAFRKLVAETGRTLPDEYAACVERMSRYLAYTLTPAGTCPLNNDADVESVAGEVLSLAEAFNRPDWTYIVTNGARGVKPEGPPSAVFPWAGHVVMRSGWERDAHWGFFDVGPLGIGHWHYDKLHLSVAAYGRDILVDAGRYTYQGGPWRAYFVGSASHNVILVDGQGQGPNEKESAAAMTGNYAVMPEYDFAQGVFDSGFHGVTGAATHQRAVLYVRGGYWLVVDRIATDRPRDITALWHFHPSCTVAADGSAVASVDEGQGNVRVTPSTGIDWKLELIKGREGPAIQGWWSRRYNIKEPNTCAVYTARIDGPATFAWLIVPAKGRAPAAAVTVENADEICAKARVEPAGNPARTWRIPFKAGDLQVE